MSSAPAQSPVSEVQNFVQAWAEALAEGMNKGSRFPGRSPPKRRRRPTVIFGSLRRLPTKPYVKCCSASIRQLRPGWRHRRQVTDKRVPRLRRTIKPYCWDCSARVLCWSANTHQHKNLICMRNSSPHPQNFPRPRIGCGLIRRLHP